jgi:hypothetical protein
MPCVTSNCAGLLLRDESAAPHDAASHQVTDSELHQVTASQLAVDRQIEDREVTQPAFALQVEAHRPHLLWPERQLGADEQALVPGTVDAGCSNDGDIGRHLGSPRSGGMPDGRSARRGARESSGSTGCAFSLQHDEDER